MTATASLARQRPAPPDSADRTARAGLLGSGVALFAGLCCLAPSALLLLGVTGGGVAILGAVAAAGFWILGLATLLVALAGLVAWRRGALRRLRNRLIAAAALVLVAWAVVLSEGPVTAALGGAS